MTLIKWKPRQLSINDFDQMINNIFNDGWNMFATTTTTDGRIICRTINHFGN